MLGALGRPVDHKDRGRGGDDELTPISASCGTRVAQARGRRAARRRAR